MTPQPDVSEAVGTTIEFAERESSTISDGDLLRHVAVWLDNHQGVDLLAVTAEWSSGWGTDYRVLKLHVEGTPRERRRKVPSTVEAPRP